jgi:GNAT superfamily N-acetyltransferase
MDDVVAARRSVPADHVEIERLRAAAQIELTDLRGGDVLLSSVETSELAATTWGEVAVFVGTIGDAVVGFARVSRRGARADLEELYVELAARRVGVGDALLGSVTEWAEEGGCTAIDARALPGARDTKNFFEGHGMVSRLIVVAKDLNDGH